MSDKADVLRGLKRAWARSGWPCVVVAAALVPVHGLFTLTRIFHVRDLSLYFWPRHLWLRETLQSGYLPWWDPYPAGGQAAFPDPLNHLFFPPAMLLRLLLPEVVGFNLWVALPLPLAAAGAYVLFRTRLSGPAAALGALVFAYAGPVISTLIYPNLSWSVALMPWVVWAGRRAVEHSGRGARVAFASAVALQALAGEPVTLAATLVLVVAFCWSERIVPIGRLLPRLAVAIGAGVLVAAVQLVPLAMASLRSPRAGMTNDGMWSLHPLAALEIVLPYVFGSPYDVRLSVLPWLSAFSGGRDRLLYSLYLGIGAATLVCAAAASACWKWMRFWAWAAVIGRIASLGEFSIPYRLLQSLVPPVETFRFPVKYLSICALAAGALAASGWTALQSSSHSGAGLRRTVVPILGIAAFAVIAAAFLAVVQSTPAVASLAARVGIREVAAAVDFIANTVPSLLLRPAVLGAAAAALLAIAGSVHRRRGLAAAGVFGLALLDPLLVNLKLNPTISASPLREPGWVQLTKETGDGRAYVGGRIPDPADVNQPIDGPRRLYMAAELSNIDAKTLAFVNYVLTPSAWRLREIVSYDLPALWSKEYADTLKMFSVADAGSRWRFLARTGVRYCLVREPFHASARVLLTLPEFDSMVLYECNPAARRAFVSATVFVEPDPRERIARLFDASLASDAVLLSEP